MSARELRYHARGRGLTVSFHEGRGNRRTTLIDFLVYGDLERLPGWMLLLCGGGTVRAYAALLS